MLAVTAALHFLGLFAGTILPSVKTMQELPTARVEGPWAHQCVWQCSWKKGCKRSPWLQCWDSAEHLILPARKQSAFHLAQLLVQKTSLSLCLGVSSPLLKNPIIPAVFVEGRSLTLMERGTNPNPGCMDTKPTWCIRYHTPSSSLGAAVGPFPWDL